MDYRVIVVDDDLFVRRTISNLTKRLAPRIVSGLDFLVEEAADGDEALLLIGLFSPDLVFMDTEMPGPLGYEVCRRVRSELGRGIYFVGMSADPSYADTWTEYGADAFLAKPFDISKLRLMLECALDRR